MHALSSSMLCLLMVCSACAGDAFNADDTLPQGGSAGAGGEGSAGSAGSSGSAGNAGDGGSAGNAGDGGSAGDDSEGGGAGDSGSAGDSGEGGGAGDGGSAGDGGEGGGAGDGGDGGEGGEAGAAGSAPFCGDGQRNTSTEQCDGADFGALTCNTSGALACTSDCQVQLSTCGGEDCGPATMFQKNAPWPSRRRCVTGVGRSAVTSAQSKHLNWSTVLLGGDPPIYGSTAPLIDANNNIIIASGSNAIFKLSAQGNVISTLKLASLRPDTAALNRQGNIVYQTDQSTVLLGGTNDLVEQVLLPIPNGRGLLLLPPVANDTSTQFIVCTDVACHVQRVSTSSKTTLSGATTGPLVLAHDTLVLVPTTAGLDLIDLTDQTPAGPVVPLAGAQAKMLPPIARGDGTVFYSGFQFDNVGVLGTLTGDHLEAGWSTTVDVKHSLSSFILDPIGTPYIAIDNTWQSVGPDHALSVEYTADSFLLDVSIFGADGTAYLGTVGGELLAVRGGQLIWSDTFEQGEQIAGMAIDSIGRLIVLGTHGQVRQYAQN